MHIFLCPSKEGYLQLASISFGQNKRLFRVRPKTHMLAEIGLAMLELGQNNRCCLSPIATCTWSDEDFIGRVSRCARSTHGATVSVSTMNKCLGMYSLQLKHLATKKRSWTCRMSQENVVKVRVGDLAGKWGQLLGNHIKVLELLKPLEIKNFFFLGEWISRMYIYIYIFISTYIYIYMYICIYIYSSGV